MDNQDIGESNPVIDETENAEDIDISVTGHTVPGAFGAARTSLQAITANKFDKFLRKSKNDTKEKLESVKNSTKVAVETFYKNFTHDVLKIINVNFEGQSEIVIKLFAEQTSLLNRMATAPREEDYRRMIQLTKDIQGIIEENNKELKNLFVQGRREFERSLTNKQKKFSEQFFEIQDELRRAEVTQDKKIKSQKTEAPKK